MKYQSLLLILFLIIAIPVIAQVEYSGSINLEGYYSNNEELPFWFYSNQRGRISEETNIAGWISGRMNYKISNKSSLEIGAGLLYQDDYLNDDYIDELYADFKYSWIQLIAGRKQEEELYDGLSASNENILWSLNSRPLYGLQLQTNRPVYFSPNQRIGLLFAWEDYYQNDHEFSNRFTHHKKLQLVLNFSESFTVQGGIQHFAQWGGNSERFGKQPESIKDYLRIVGGRAGGDTAVKGDQENALGNHLGSWELYLTKRFRNSELKFIYNSIFEDGSGSRLANFPDGRYGLFWKSEEKDRLVNSAIYEYYHTKDQSHDVNRWGADNYFNSSFYTRGWAYQNKVIGSPLFTYDPEINKVINNKFSAHHIGIGGGFNYKFVAYPYKLLITYLRKDGTYLQRYIPKRDEIYLNYNMQLLQKPFDLRINLGAEYSSVATPIYGVGLSLSKQF